MFQTELELFGKMIQGENHQFFDANYGIEILGLVEACRESSQNQSTRINLEKFLLNIRDH